MISKIEIQREPHHSLICCCEYQFRYSLKVLITCSLRRKGSRLFVRPVGDQLLIFQQSLANIIVWRNISLPIIPSSDYERLFKSCRAHVYPSAMAAKLNAVQIVTLADATQSEPLPIVAIDNVLMVYVFDRTCKSRKSLD